MTKNRFEIEPIFVLLLIIRDLGSRVGGIPMHGYTDMIIQVHLYQHEIIVKCQVFNIVHNRVMVGLSVSHL